MDDVHAVLAELGAQSAAAKGQEAAPEAPATPPPTPAVPAAGPDKSTPPPKDAAPVTPPAPPAKVPYTAEEFAAFDGNYHSRDFDWERWPTDLLHTREFIRKNASSYGKKFDELQRERAELERLRQAPTQPPQSQVTPAPTANDELTAEQMTEAQELLATPGKGIEGLRMLLGSRQGRDLLTTLGYSDPAERAVVSELAEERIITRAIQNISEDFPMYLADGEAGQKYRNEVGQVFDETPLLTQKVKSRSVEEATFAFAVANAITVSRRLGARETALTSRETKLTERETAIVAKEAELQRQIEATNRVEPVSPAVGQQAAGTPAAKLSRRDEVLEAMRAGGMAVG